MTSIESKYWESLTPEERVIRWSHAVKVIGDMTEHEIKYHFDMSLYGQKTPCGTVGCAAGHLGLDPGFNRQGYKLDIDSGYLDGFTIHPINFFGKDAYYNIFVNDDFTSEKGEKVHAEVLKAMKSYLKDLEEEAET